MRLILLGCPGAGKGTQAKLISATYHIPQISTGDILRAAIQEASELGKQVKAIVDSGRLVPDDIMIALIKERLSRPDTQHGFLLDGFPRTVEQAEALRQLTPIDYVIDIDVPEEEVVRRLTGRRIHPASGRIYHIESQPAKTANKDDVTGEPLIQRVDDSEETVRKRLAIYHQQTEPLRDYYSVSGNPMLPHYQKIVGTGSVEDITKKIFAILDARAPRNDTVV